MAIAAAAASGGPGWTDILTAIGTVGAVVVALGIAWWSDRRLRQERADEKAVREEERRLALEREQFAEAYAVQIVSARASVAEVGQQSDPSDPSMCPMAIIVNHGRYAITKVNARFSNGETIHRLTKTEHLSVFPRLPVELKGAAGEAMPWPDDFDVVSLTPQDPGLRLIGPALLVSRSLLVYPLVRWTDRWGTRWEHRRGVARPVREDEPWEL